jgi:hypothetical protein
MQDGELIWDFIQLPNLGFIGNTGSQLDIYGTPTNLFSTGLNGYSLEFADERMCPVEIGDINYGDTFNNMPLSEGLRRIIYDYLPPTCSIEITGVYSVGYAEVGTYPTPSLQYTINKKTLNTVTTGLSNMIPGAYPAIVSNSYETITGSSSGVVISPIPPVSTEFTITVGDGLNTASASTQITGIYPYFYGFSTNTTMNSIGLAGLSKLTESMGDKTIDVNGIGNLYFIYDSDYGTLSNIYDEYGNTSSGSFSYTTEILSSPTGLWAAKEFYVYQWNGAPQIGPPSVNYQQVNIADAIDNRLVVGPSQFYTDKDDLPYKYTGMRVWDLNSGVSGVPYVWTGTTFSTEASSGIAGSGTPGVISKFIGGGNVLADSIIKEVGVNIGIGTMEKELI